MSTASVAVTPHLIPVRNTSSAVIRTGGLLVPLSPLPVRGYDYETSKPLVFPTRPSPPEVRPAASEEINPAASVATPAPVSPVAPMSDATVTPAAELGSVVPATEDAVQAKIEQPADVVAGSAPLYTPSPETLAFLRMNKHINFDTQLVEVRTTGRLDNDPFHRENYLSVAAQEVPNLRVVQRSDTGAILGHVGGAVSMKFTPCQNAYLVESLHRAGMFDKMDAIRVDCLKGGALVVIAMETKDEALMYETPMGSARFRMGFWNGHAGNHTVSVAPMLNLPSGGDVPLFSIEGGLAGEQNIRHTRSVNDTVADLSKAWGRSMELAAGVAKTLTSLGDFKITRQEFDAVLLAAMNKTLDGRHADIPGNAERFKTTLMAHTYNRTPETLLELADAVAAHIDFDRPVRGRKGIPEDIVRAESASVGVGARMKNAVLAEALAFLKRT